MYIHVRVHVGWGRVENGCGINFLCAVINFYNLFVFSVLSLCGEEVEETEIQSMAADQQTYYCSNVIGNRIIQVSKVSLPLSLSCSLTPYSYIYLSLLLFSSLPPPSLTISLFLPLSHSPSLTIFHSLSLSLSNLMLLCSFFV